MPHSTIKLAIVCSHPIQYFAPLFRNLAGQAEIDVTVFYTSRQSAEPRVDPGFGQVVRWDIPLLEWYNYQFLPNRRLPTLGPGWQSHHPSRLDGKISGAGKMNKLLNSLYDRLIEAELGEIGRTHDLPLQVRRCFNWCSSISSSTLYTAFFKQWVLVTYNVLRKGNQIFPEIF